MKFHLGLVVVASLILKKNPFFFLILWHYAAGMHSGSVKAEISSFFEDLLSSLSVLNRVSQPLGLVLMTKEIRCETTWWWLDITS